MATDWESLFNELFEEHKKMLFFVEGQEIKSENKGRRHYEGYFKSVRDNTERIIKKIENRKGDNHEIS